MLPLILMGSSPMYEEPQRELTEEEKEALRRLRAEKDIERKVKRGLNPFDYNGKIIWALNKKNADRKSNL